MPDSTVRGGSPGPRSLSESRALGVEIQTAAWSGGDGVRIIARFFSGICLAKRGGMWRCGVLVGLLLFSSSAWSAARSRPSLMGVLFATVPAHAVRRVQQAAPSVRALHQAVRAAADLADREERRWGRRTRWAAAFPRLQIGVRQNLADDVNLHLDDTVSVSGSGVVIGPRASGFTQRSDRTLQLDVRALWDLQELVFSPDAVFVSREARERRREGQQRLHEANQLFTQWQVLRAWQLAPHGEVPAAMVMQQLTFVQAELDALTDGWFSAQGHQR